ncbi:hypothetical protein BC834DRAFT_427945 [Gloeopeniophorella convolvens]|nr:hypothetical protein BC834DRAFT_427945 [Gloeopeniophorella convolvens]
MSGVTTQVSADPSPTTDGKLTEGSTPERDRKASLLSSLFHHSQEFIKPYLEDPKLIVLVPFSWSTTVLLFALAITWFFITLPTKIAVDLYDRRIRALLPWLPSVRQMLLTVFPHGILPHSISGFKFLNGPPQKHESLPTLPVDWDVVTGGDAETASNPQGPKD